MAAARRQPPQSQPCGRDRLRGGSTIDGSEIRCGATLDLTKHEGVKTAGVAAKISQTRSVERRRAGSSAAEGNLTEGTPPRGAGGGIVQEFCLAAADCDSICRSA